MKKGLIASLVTYLGLLIAAVVMMLVYLISKNINAAANVDGLKTAILVVFIAFVVTFVVVISLLILYPKTLSKVYKDNIKSFMAEHNQKYPDKDYKIITNYKDKNVYISFMMGENDIDTYSFPLKETPLTKNEPRKIAYNVIADLTIENETSSIGQ